VSEIGCCGTADDDDDDDAAALCLASLLPPPPPIVVSMKDAIASSLLSSSSSSDELMVDRMRSRPLREELELAANLALMPLPLALGAELVLVAGVVAAARGLRDVAGVGAGAGAGVGVGVGAGAGVGATGPDPGAASVLDGGRSDIHPATRSMRNDEPSNSSTQSTLSLAGAASTLPLKVCRL